MRARRTILDAKLAIRSVVILAALGTTLTLAPDARAGSWSLAANCLKAIGADGYVGEYGIWALSCTASPVAGNWKLVKADWVANGNGENPYWQWDLDPQGGAGSSITVKYGIPYVVSAASNVWYKANNNWVAYPSNRTLARGGHSRSVKSWATPRLLLAMPATFGSSRRVARRQTPYAIGRGRVGSGSPYCPRT
jgi:hypothetical protein